MAEIIRSVADLRERSAKSFAQRKDPENALLCPPDSFDVIDVKNAHMKDQIGRVNKKKAQAEWQALCEAIIASGRQVQLIEATKGLEDMVFSANPVLVGDTPEGKKICLLSNMKHPSRKKEVPAYEKWFAARGYAIAKLSRPEWNFEGEGDALWHPNRRLLWGGFGFRTVPEVYKEISELFSTPVVTVQLLDERFYHLDTCLCPLSETETLYCAEAFQPEGVELIHALFTKAFAVPLDEAAKGFACNALVLGKKVLIQKGNRFTNETLRKWGYQPMELETGEFMKSGGSVFCMKMMVFGESSSG